MLNLFETKYTKHAMTVGGGVVGAYFAKNGMENAAKATGETSLLKQKTQHAHELARIALEHDNTLIKMEKEHEFTEKNSTHQLICDVLSSNLELLPEVASMAEIESKFTSQAELIY